MLRGFRRGVLGLFIGLLVLSPIVATLTPSVAEAAQDNPLDQLERWLYYRGMRACLSNPDFDSTIPADDNGTRSAADINGGQLDIQQKKGFGYLAPDMDGASDNDGTVDCMDGSIFVRGATMFGFDNTVQLVCAMNRALPSADDGRITPSHPTDCEKSEEFEFDGGGGDVFQQALTKALEREGSKDRPAFNINDNNLPPKYSYKSLLYLIGKHSLEVFCGNNASLESAIGGDVDDDDIVSVDVVKSDGTVDKSQPYPLANADRDENSKVDDVYYNQGGDSNNAQDLRCHEMAKMTRDNSASYALWAKDNKEAFEENEGGSGGGETGDESGAGQGETTCAIDGIGWIVCPVMTFTANIIDKAYQQVASWLSVTPISTTGGGTAMYSAWVGMRDIANVAFVIAFMIIVYSQLTSAGVSNYGIKKLLPKIVIAAILVNVSYILCAIAVDISNIAGVSLYSLLGAESFGKGIDTSHFEGDAASTDGGWVGIVGAILASSAIIYLALPALIVALPTALLAIVTVFLVLALRQVLIILLIVISPLAFIALLLPNTEDWFKRWRKLFTSMLLMYPIISLLFGASALASTVVMNSATDVNGDGKISLQLMGALITVLPLVLTPVLMKASSGVLNRFAGIVNNPNRGPFDAMRKRAEATAGRIRNNRDIRAINRGGLSMRRRGLEGAAKRDAIQRQRDGAVKSLAYQGSVQGYTKRANDQDKITKTMENDFETRDIQGQLDGAGLHADVRADLHNSEFSRKVAESTEKSRAEEAHVMNNRNAYQQMYDASENLEAMNTESHNDYGRTAQGETTAQRVKTAGGEKKIIEGEHELAFQSSQVGGNQAQQMKAVDGQLDIVRGEQEVTFEGSGVGVAQAITKDNVAQRKATVTARSEAAAVEQNADVRINAQAAKDTLDVAKADEAAFIQELRTDAGAQEYLISQQSPEVQATVQELQVADTQKRVQGQRTANAQKVANVEYAQSVGKDPANPSQIAVEAAGIAGTAGVSQAQAVAFQTMVKAHNEGVAAEKTLFSQTKNEALLDRFDEPDFLDQPDEQISAIAGTIAGRQHQESHIKLWEKMGKLTQQAQAELAAAPDQASKDRAQEKIEKLKNMQQQVMGDKKKTPFGVGDRDQGQADIGEYAGDIYESTRDRISTHMSAQKLSTMDPDDISLIFEMAREGKLSADELNKVATAYDEWEKDPLLRSTLQDKHKLLLDPIRQHATTGTPGYPPGATKYPEIAGMTPH